MLQTLCGRHLCKLGQTSCAAQSAVAACVGPPLRRVIQLLKTQTQTPPAAGAAPLLATLSAVLAIPEIRTPEHVATWMSLLAQWLRGHKWPLPHAPVPTLANLLLGMHILSPPLNVAAPLLRDADRAVLRSVRRLRNAHAAVQRSQPGERLSQADWLEHWADSMPAMAAVAAALQAPPLQPDELCMLNVEVCADIDAAELRPSGCRRRPGSQLVPACLWPHVGVESPLDAVARALLHIVTPRVSLDGSDVPEARQRVRSNMTRPQWLTVRECYRALHQFQQHELRLTRELTLAHCLVLGVLGPAPAPTHNTAELQPPPPAGRANALPHGVRAMSTNATSTVGGAAGERPGAIAADGKGASHAAARSEAHGARQTFTSRARSAALTQASGGPVPSVASRKRFERSAAQPGVARAAEQSEPSGATTPLKPRAGEVLGPAAPTPVDRRTESSCGSAHAEAGRASPEASGDAKLASEADKLQRARDASARGWFTRTCMTLGIVSGRQRVAARLRALSQPAPVPEALAEAAAGGDAREGGWLPPHIKSRAELQLPGLLAQQCRASLLERSSANTVSVLAVRVTPCPLPEGCLLHRNTRAFHVIVTCTQTASHRQPCHRAYRTAKAQGAALLQQAVIGVLQLLRYHPVEEWSPPGVPQATDFMVRGVTANGEVRHVAFEVDGPQHYLSDGRRNARTTRRDAVLLLSGIEVRGRLLVLSPLHVRAVAAQRIALASLSVHATLCSKYVCTQLNRDFGQRPVETGSSGFLARDDPLF